MFRHHRNATEAIKATTSCRSFTPEVQQEVITAFYEQNFAANLLQTKTYYL